MAGLHQVQLLVGHQTGSISSTSTLTTAFKGGPNEVLNNNSSGDCGDVKALCKAGRLKEALHILNQGGIRADSNTYVCVLQECINMKALAEGKQVHAHIIGSGFKPNIFLFKTLVNMYAKCGSVLDARRVFDKMAKRDVVTWTIMMAGYAKHGCGRESFLIYEQMIGEGVTPNRVTFICILIACAGLGVLEKGKEVHAHISRSGILPDITLENSLVDMYSKCGSMVDALEVFDTMSKRDVVTWTVMMAGYANHGCTGKAFKIYEQMKQQGVSPNRVTFICILNACASLGALEKGKEVHADIGKSGTALDIVLENTLVDMYAKCGSVKDAGLVFRSMAKRDVVSWSAMIGGYSLRGCGKEALEIYDQMILEGVRPNRVTFTCVINACASLGTLEKGKVVHADISKSGIAPDIILQNALIDMYFKCGGIEDSRQLFNNMLKRDVVSWSVMIAGYSQHGCGREALEMYGDMILEGVTPNKVTFICILRACASLAALEKGKEIHADIMKAGILPYINLENALVDMYAKCGSIKDACQVFDNMSERDVVSWNAMIAGYAQHGCGREALQLFEQMQQEGLKPNSITFLCLLSACSHVGLVDEGRHYYNSMSKDHEMTPTVEHFGCMVGLIGRGGRLVEAQDFIKKMPIEPGASVWAALLGACRVQDNVDLAEDAAKYILNSDPQNAAALFAGSLQDSLLSILSSLSISSPVG